MTDLREAGHSEPGDPGNLTSQGWSRTPEGRSHSPRRDELVLQEIPGSQGKSGLGQEGGALTPWLAL